MLILPLHRPLSWAHFPVVTLTLILVNCFVFFFLQSGDDAKAEQAWAQYRQSHLPALELPAYREWMSGHGHAEQARQLAALHEAADRVTFQLLQSDVAFQRELHAERIVTPENKQYAQWKDEREAIDAAWSRRFTERYEMLFSDVSVKRMFGAMFLHGGVGHLFGNMLFLAFLGLLVEGALGPWLFLALYLLGGIGGQLVSLAWRWGDSGAALGASGAIASLMGAYCVLWGLRRVRFFWWFFVAFDYIKAPALVLLPVWLGWEVLNLVFNTGANVGFDAHAGGILSGALLAFGVRALKWERHDFLDVEVKEDQQREDAAQFQRAMALVGKLEVAKARPLLEALDARQPGQWPVLAALYRCARYGGDVDGMHRRAQAALGVAVTGVAPMREQKALYEDYAKACAYATQLPPAVLLRLARDAIKLGEDEDAEKILLQLASRDANQPGLAEACFALAQRPATPSLRRRRLGFVAERFAQHGVAAKARFLLAEGA